MLLKRIAGRAVFVALLSAGAALHAAGASTFTVPIVNVHFNPSTCSTLAATDVTLNGQYHFSVHTAKNPDGTYTTKIQSEAHGTAVDNLGNSYVFNYINHEQDVTSTPNDVPPILGNFTDRFSLTGKGRAPDLKVVFQISFVVDASGNFQVLYIAAKGDPDCDPI